MKTVYLCGPINGRSDDDCKTWREQVKASWPGETIDPMARDYRGRELDPGIAKEIVENDIADIRSSDALLVYCDKPSVGTSMEVFFAKHCLRKPVIVIHPGDNPSPWLMYHADKIVKTVEDGLKAIGVILESKNVIEAFAAKWPHSTFVLIDFVHYLHRRGIMVSDTDAEQILSGNSQVVAKENGKWSKA